MLYNRDEVDKKYQWRLSDIFATLLESFCRKFGQLWLYKRSKRFKADKQHFHSVCAEFLDDTLYIE